MENLQNILKLQYSLDLLSLKSVPGGWSADAYSGATKEGDSYFIKVYQKNRPSVLPLIRRIDFYIPALLWLSQNTKLQDSITPPLLTKNGEYKVETADVVVLVFPKIRGFTFGEKPLDPPQLKELTQIISLLHSSTDKLPKALSLQKENYDLPFLDMLAKVRGQKEISAPLKTVLGPYAELIASKTSELKKLANILQVKKTKFVLCHTDIHGGNLMWDGKLILLDWEGLQLAPAEADLFVFTDGFFFDYAQKDVWPKYQKLRNDYGKDEEALAFYRLRRHLEDISEFVFSIAYDNLSPAKQEDFLNLLRSECEKLKIMRLNFPAGSTTRGGGC